jgi:hypothetical protein
MRVGNAWSIAHEGRLESDAHENMGHARRRAGDSSVEPRSGVVPQAMAMAMAMDRARATMATVSRRGRQPGTSRSRSPRAGPLPTSA